MKETRVKEENFICIQGWMISKLNLKGNDLLVYAIIYGYSQDGSSWFSGGLQYLADWINGTKQGVIKNLKHLESRGLIKKVSEVVDKITVTKYQYIPEVLSDYREADDELDYEEKNCILEEQEKNLEQEINKIELVKELEQNSIGMDQNLIGHETEFNEGGKQSLMGYETEFNGGDKQSLMGYETEFNGGVKQSLPNNINIINQKKNTKDTSQGDKPTRAELIKSIADQWNGLEDYGIRPIRRLSTDSIRYGMLNARINDYGYESVIQAIESIKRSPFLQGDNDRGWRIDFEWFVKPNNFCKVWEGKYIDDQKGAKNNDNNRGYSGKYNSANTGQAGRKYDPADFFGDQWQE